MAQIQTYSVSPREIEGKKVKQLRRDGLVPANIYGKKGSHSVSVLETQFIKMYEKLGETGVAYLEIEGSAQKHPVMIDEVQVHPTRDNVLHVTFHEVNLSEKIKAEIPIELTGEFGMDDAVMIQVLNSIEVEALPTDLPESFVVDISGLNEIGQSITLESLTVDTSKVTLMLDENGLEAPVVLVQAQQEEVVEETPIEGEGVAAEGAESSEATSDTTTSGDESSNDSPTQSE